MNHIRFSKLTCILLLFVISACAPRTPAPIATSLPPAVSPTATTSAPVSHWWVVTAGSDNTARVWDAVTGETIAILQGHTGPVNSASFSPDGKWIVTASEDKTARVWEAATGKAAVVLSGNDVAVADAVFSPDGKLIAIVAAGIIYIYDAMSGQEVMQLTIPQASTRPPATTPSFSPDGKWLASAVEPSLGPVSVWDIATGQLVSEFTQYPPGGIDFNNATFSPDGKFVAISTGNFQAPLENVLSTVAYVWEHQTGATIAEFKGHSHSVLMASFSPDSQWVVTASRDQTAQVWEAATGNVISVLSGHTGSVYSAFFSPDGKWVVTASADGMARVWEAETGKSVSVLTGHTSLVLLAVFSPDGKFVATASLDNTARVWDAATGAMIAQLSGHTAAVNTAVFSPDQK